MRKKYTKCYASSGFTLVECLVIVLILGILGAITLPNWLALLALHRLNKSQNQVYSAIRQAQIEAVKDKVAWQVSFREHNSFVQWAIHPAEPGKFVPDSVVGNNKIWYNLEPEIYLDQVRNNKGKYETTLSKQTTPQMWRVVFNHQGCPVFQVGDECTQTSLRTLGQITLSSKNGGKAKRCVYISTIIGAVRTGKEHDRANENSKYCY